MRDLVEGLVGLLVLLAVSILFGLLVSRCDGAPAPPVRPMVLPAAISSAEVCRARTLVWSGVRYRCHFTRWGHYWCDTGEGTQRYAGFWDLDGGTLRVRDRCQPAHGPAPDEPLAEQPWHDSLWSVRLERRGADLAGRTNLDIDFALTGDRP